MKKINHQILSLIMALVLILPFVFACTNDEDEKEETPKEPVKEKTFAEMTEKEKALHILDLEIDSVNTRMDMTMNLESVYYGLPLTVNAVMWETEMGIGTDNYIHASRSTMSMDMTVRSTEIIEGGGYKDGKMFAVQVTDSRVDFSNWSAISQADYIAYKESLEEENESTVENYGITEQNCKTMTCVQNEDGNWVATYTDLTSDGLSEFVDLLESFEGMIDPSALTDIKMELTVTSDLVPVKADITFEFSGETPPVFAMGATFKFGDDVEEPLIELDGYTEVDDLREPAE